MNSSQRRRLDNVNRNGRLFMSLFSRTLPDLTAKGYLVYESRGFRTDYKRKPFFYLVTSDQNGPFSIHGITKNIKRKTFKKHCREHNINCEIHNQKLFDMWME